MRRLAALAVLSAVISPLRALAQSAPAPEAVDFVVRDSRFASGETLPELKLHATTLGHPRRDGKGRVTNAVLILHGTSGAGTNFLGPAFGGVLFGPGQLLDATRYYLVLPDSVGHGASSKPSDGLHARFPHYTYDDMVVLQHRLLTEKLNVNHVRLVLGTSMGGMHAWVWGETYPEFMDALLPLASQPAAIAGRNRMWRKVAMDAIRNDPDWKNGDYTAQPRGLQTAMDLMLMVIGSAWQWQIQAPTRDAADAAAAGWIRDRAARTDANDLLYALDASRDYDPEPKLGAITAPLVAVNFADDFINPPELGLLERGIAKVKHGRAVVFPLNEKTRGHATHSMPEVWKGTLEELLRASEPKPETTSAPSGASRRPLRRCPAVAGG